MGLFLFFFFFGLDFSLSLPLNFDKIYINAIYYWCRHEERRITNQLEQVSFKLMMLRNRDYPTKELLVDRTSFAMSDEDLPNIEVDSKNSGRWVSDLIYFKYLFTRTLLVHVPRSQPSFNTERTRTIAIHDFQAILVNGVMKAIGSGKICKATVEKMCPHKIK